MGSTLLQPLRFSAIWAVWILSTTGFCLAGSDSETQEILTAPRQPSDEAPFSKGDRYFEMNFLRGFGITDFGGRERHDFLLSEFKVGYTATRILAPDRFYGGSLEWTAHIFAGSQDHPDPAYLVGLNPGFRYHFHTGTRWVPYVGLNAGVLLTDLGEPDQGGHFQFNEQAGIGLHWFVSEGVAFNAEYRYMHISNAGLSDPNKGVNDHLAILGLGWFF